MKHFRIPYSLLSVMLVAACEVPALSGTLAVRLPPTPAAWEAVLGRPRWRLEWLDGEGRPQRADPAEAGSRLELDPLRASPVLAWPYWPDYGTLPGEVRPAGAVYPFDLEDEKLVLSWPGGVAAVFFRELSRSEGDAQTLPERFDWPRFRALLADDSLSAAVRADPWLVDWRSVARRTRASGFDRRRLVAAAAEPLTLRVPAAGPWAPDSPFGTGGDWVEGQSVDLELSAEARTYFCARGRWRYAAGQAMFYPRP